jgi:hypothetical protein
VWWWWVTAQAADLDVYTREGCPRCLEARPFLTALEAERPELDVAVHRVDADPAARAALEAALDRAGIRVPGVPAFVVGDAVVVGWIDEATTGRQVRALLDDEGVVGELGGTCAVDDAEPCATDAVDTAVGRVSLDALGLPLFTIVVGLLDGFNPCAMWVLLFLLSLLSGVRDRRRMALVAGTFVLTSGLVYYAFLAAWLQLFLLLGMSRPAQVVLGVVSLAVGALQTKEFVALGQGPSPSIPASAKPGLMDRMRAVARADHLGPAMASVAVLAVLVNLVELLCTAGFPAVYTGILTRQGLPAPAYYAYLGLYDLAYVVDDSLVVGTAVWTLSRRRLQEREGRWLKLVGGLVMMALAVAMLFFPQLLAF